MSAVNNEYEAVIALLGFATAYKKLVSITSAMPDLDLSDNYPFFLLDFEDITPSVIQWSNIHASRLMANLPDRVDNPACIGCRFLKGGLATNGLCRGQSAMNCSLYPIVPYSIEMAKAYLLSKAVNIPSNADANFIRLLYQQQIEKETEDVQEKLEATKI